MVDLQSFYVLLNEIYLILDDGDSYGAWTDTIDVQDGAGGSPAPGSWTITLDEGSIESSSTGMKSSQPRSMKSPFGQS